MTNDNPSTASTDENTTATAAAPTDSRTADEQTDDTPDDDMQTAVVDALDDHTVPLTGTDPGGPFDGIDAFRHHLGDARVVGLGEATHGTREFFDLKHRVIQYLVTELDCRAVALEANFSEALALDDYVVHGEGDPRDALDAIYFWTWNVESVLALVEWLREFNADRPLDDRVRFYGVDAQYSQGAVDALRDFLGAVDPDFLDAVSDDLDAAADDGEPPHQDDDCETRIAAAERLVPRLRERLDDHGAAYAAQTDAAAVGMARQHGRVLEQVAGYKRGFLDQSDDEDPDIDTIEARLEQRDRSMADNLEWILGRTVTDRVAVWAHDSHLNRVHQQSRGLDATAPSMGSFLADRHGDDYYAIGFAFGRGAFQALTDESGVDDEESDYELGEQTLDAPLPDTIAATLADVGNDVALTDLRSACNDDRLAEWLGRPQQHFSTGATYDPENPEQYVGEYVYGDAFDALCYVDETSRARPVDDE